MAAKKKSGGAKTVAKKAGDDLKPATKTAASGAIIEPDLAEDSVPDHPAVDANPRAGLPAESNAIDFNNPRQSPEEAVQENLSSQR